MVIGSRTSGISIGMILGGAVRVALSTVSNFPCRMTTIQKEEEKEGIQPEEEGAINLPSMEVARTFSVETIDYPHPLGVHQVHRWLKEQMLSLDEWCPEYKLCSEGYIKDTHEGR